ncbi:2-C-methyl-D-erythritol 4-phosphate cytidylyltransferase [Kineococcus xinjiangensis]|uniref:2-C-methyl-D-erythritol 4-phosphate cytidylyltransferase n=1 Tax=Kineococcus xinjiangensis TaxID=512762 RepID=A0A2S6ICZ9_9ACTN|nr:2-C-methyl-D-erythritol 4-phosphate cytidylyltransferase [Kineococcus xinjiangensis]
MELDGRPLLVHALERAVASGVIDVIAVACPPGAVEHVRILLEGALPVEPLLVEGAGDRQASVWAALSALPADADVVLVHDAARCLTPPAVFADVVRAVRAGAAGVVPVLPVTDTVKRVRGGRVVETVDRAELQAVQTPQGFRTAVLRAVHDAARGAPATDDAGLLEAAGHRVHVVPGAEEAFKVTRPLDLVLARALLAAGNADPPVPEGGTDRER